MRDPRALPEFVVAVCGAPGVGKSALRTALLDVDALTSEVDLARLDIVEGLEAGPRGATLYVVRGMPTDAHGVDLDALRSIEGAPVFVAVHAQDLAVETEEDIRAAWESVAEPDLLHVTATPPDGLALGVERLRAALFAAAIEGVDASVSDARRAKRPYAVGIIAGAVVVSAGEALLPGAAAFVVSSQVAAIGSLSYLYTGKGVGRGQALAMLPVFATEAAGGSLFLLAKSFFPPTGVADAAAAAVAATLTMTMLGAVAWSLEHGYALDQKEQLRAAFRRLRARGAAERAELLRNRSRWRDKSFWSDVVRRVLFEG